MRFWFAICSLISTASSYSINRVQESGLNPHQKKDFDLTRDAILSHVDSVVVAYDDDGNIPSAVPKSNPEPLTSRLEASLLEQEAQLEQELKQNQEKTAESWLNEQVDMEKTLAAIQKHQERMDYKGTASPMMDIEQTVEVLTQNQPLVMQNIEFDEDLPYFMNIHTRRP